MDECMTDYIYARTSTKEQNVQQQSKFLADKYPGALKVEENFTGITTNRPGFQNLLKLLSGGDKLIVREISRIGRTTTEVLLVADELKARNVDLIVDNLDMNLTTPAGQMVLTVLAAAAQMEKSLLLERQAIGIRRAKAEGKYKGGKGLDPNIIKTAKTLIASGMTKTRVAKQLNIGVSTLYKYLALEKENK